MSFLEQFGTPEAFGIDLSNPLSIPGFGSSNLSGSLTPEQMSLYQSGKNVDLGGGWFINPTDGSINQYGGNPADGAQFDPSGFYYNGLNVGANGQFNATRQNTDDGNLGSFFGDVIRDGGPALLMAAGVLAGPAIAGAAASDGGGTAVAAGTAEGTAGTAAGAAAAPATWESGFQASAVADGGAGAGTVAGSTGAAVGTDAVAGSAGTTAGTTASTDLSSDQIAELMRDGGSDYVNSGAGSFGSFLQTPAGMTALTQLAGGALSVGTGSQLNGQVNSLINQSDPFSKYRPMYGDMLMSQMTNPDVSKVPGFEAGLQAVQRAGAAQGFTGSGNMANSLLQYGGGLWQQQEQDLAQLAGANITPNYAPYLSALGGSAATTNAGILNLIKGAGAFAPYMTSNGGGGGTASTAAASDYSF